MTGATATLTLLALGGLIGTVDLVRVLGPVALARSAARRFLDRFWSGGDLGELQKDTAAGPRHPIAGVFLAAMDELGRSAGPGAAAAGRADRLARLAARRAVDAFAGGIWRIAAVATAAPLAGVAGALAGQGPDLAPIGLALGAAGVIAYRAATEMTNQLRRDLDGFITELLALVERQAEAARR